MEYYFAGAESASHRKVLNELEVPTVALSYVGLSRRVKFARPWIIDEKFREGTRILLDSGAHSVNNGNTEYSPGDLFDLSEAYQQFVFENLDRIEMVSEFDALVLGRDWIEEQRTEFYNDLPKDKFMPIWHVDYGLDNLKELAHSYSRVGVPATSLEGRNLAPFLNRLVADTGVKLHGVAMTKVDELLAIKWATVSSTSWFSPQQFGDTIVWTGKELKRYPKKYKEQARKRYRTLFEREGFDAEAISNDDHRELLRLSVWSWHQLMSDIDKKQGRHLEVVTNPGDEGHEAFVEPEGVEVDNPAPEERKSLVTRASTALPVLGMTTTKQIYTNEDGTTEEFDVTQIGIRSESTRLCSSCFLATKCPAFEAGSNCAYNIPVEIKTRDQFVAMQNTLIEMQAQRVMFMRFAEETDGGYADPNLSTEMDRLQKMLKTKHDMESDTFTLKVEAKSSGQGSGHQGMLARLFGEQASEKARALPQPVPADAEIEQILDVEAHEVPRFDQ